MRILLVNVPRDRRETMFPLQLAGIAAVLQAEGYQIEGFDFGTQRPRSRGPNSWPAAAEAFDVVICTACPDTYSRTRKLLDELEPDERRLTIVTGPFATLFPDEVLTQRPVDVAILGEGERVAGRIIRAWQSGEKSPIPGAVWHDRWTERGFISGRDFRRIEQLGELPPPARTIFKVDDYTGMATRRPRYTQITATRGCDRADARYPLARLLPGGRRARPVEHVIEEMTTLRDRFGITEFHFEDDGLFEDPDYVSNLCRGIRSRLAGILWQCPNNNHPDDLAVAMLADLAAAGCYRIYLQLDSPDPGAMQLLNRPWDPAHLAPLTAEAGRVGLELGGYFTLGLPDESPEQMRETVRYAVDSGLTWAQFTPFTFIPGSELFDRRDDLSRRIAPGVEIRRAARKAYWRFYGSKGRWRVVLRNVNRRNALQMVSRACEKLAVLPGEEGRPQS